MPLNTGYLILSVAHGNFLKWQGDLYYPYPYYTDKKTEGNKTQNH